MTNWWAKEQIRQALQTDTGMRPYQVEKLLETIVDLLERRRLTLVPTYLSDEMFEAQTEIDPDIKYPVAGKMYVAALERYNGYCDPPPIEPEEGGFW